MTRLRQLIQHLEQIAPAVYQEGYDNSGLIVGNPDMEIKGVMVCLDSTEAVVQEAVAKGCNVVVAHHPIVFKGLKRLTGKNYVERTVISAIKNDVALYAIHTNLDNVYHLGVNAKIAEKIGLKNTRVLAPKQQLKKLTCAIAPAISDELRQALLEVGIGQETQWSFSTLGVINTEQSGAAGVKIEVLFAWGIERAVVRTLQSFEGNGLHFYEITSVENHNTTIGSGLVGELDKPMKALAFLQLLKKNMQAACVKHTALLDRPVKTVAVCGGSGSFLLPQAIAAGADVFVTADFKYHEFFDADGHLVIADIGHYESEHFTIELLHDIISEKFSNFAVHCADSVTNPVQYL